MEDVARVRVIPVSDRDGSLTGARSFWITAAVVLLVLVGTMGAIFGGPALGDHEAMVAQCARQMRLSGDWLVPQFLDTPLIRKPPLPYWLVAGASYLFPNDPRTGLPVTTMVARLPSALAALGTTILLWHLAASMFGRRSGRIAAVLSGTSLFTMLYGANATAEMLLVFCCTWAYLHFWYAQTASTASRRRLHLLLFYLALGIGMLAKGPAPIAMVAIPLALWWFLERPLRALSRGGPRGWRSALIAGLRGFWPRIRQAFTRLWLVPGLIVFALVFLPWVWAVAIRHEHAWNLWNWQYLQRAQGDYEDTRDRGFLYYLPVVAGYLVPWVFLVFEGIAAPWMKRYARMRRSLFYVGLWGVLGILVMSAMSFKKPYYVGPAIPGLILLMTVVAERFYSRPSPLPRWAWGTWLVAAAGFALFLVVGYKALREIAPDALTGLTWIAACAFLLLLAAGALHIRGRPWFAFGLIACISVASFQTVWYACGPALDNVDKAARLAAALDKSGVPRDGTVLWADQRPDARLGFYFGRITGHMVTPQEVVDTIIDRTRGKDRLQRMAIDKATTLLDSPDPVYLILDRDHYDEWRSEIARRGRLVASVDSDAQSTKEDWVIITNAPNEPDSSDRNSSIVSPASRIKPRSVPLANSR